MAIDFAPQHTGSHGNGPLKKVRHARAQSAGPASRRSLRLSASETSPPAGFGLPRPPWRWLMLGSGLALAAALLALFGAIGQSAAAALAAALVVLSVRFVRGRAASAPAPWWHG